MPAFYFASFHQNVITWDKIRASRGLCGGIQGLQGLAVVVIGDIDVNIRVQVGYLSGVSVNT